MIFKKQHKHKLQIRWLNYGEIWDYAASPSDENLSGHAKIWERRHGFKFIPTWRKSTSDIPF